jgi:serine/threonine-protein kinase RsbW
MSARSSSWQRRDVHSFQEFRDELRRFFNMQGVPPRTARDLVLAVQEACNNARQHGAEGAGCDVAVTCLDSSITIEIADHGCGFDFEAVKATWPPAQLKSGGRGLFIIAKLSDRMEIVRLRPGTLVRVFKSLR